MHVFGIAMLAVVSIVAVPTLVTRLLKTLFLIMAKLLRPRDWLLDAPDGTGERCPRIAVQVPISNEPPDLVVETLNSLDNLDYPNFLVQVVDNNTDDESLWRPVAEFCATRQDRYYFYHVENLVGYKAGALQFALEHMPDDVELIAVVDSDNHVHRKFLREVARHFAEPSVAIVQSPLGFLRDPRLGRFSSWIFLIYRYFLTIYLPACARFQCAPFIGGMGVVRRTALEEAGGWDGLYLTEDMDLSGRLFAGGHVSRFVDCAYGTSMPPGDLRAFRKQHYRWNFGNSQIFRDRFLSYLLTGWTNWETWTRRLFYFVCPAIYSNLYFLPFAGLASTAAIVGAFGETNSLVQFACRIMLYLLAIELCCEAAMFAVLGLSERAGFVTTLKNYVAWWSLSINNSISTYAVFLQESRPFDVTGKGKRRLRRVPFCTVVLDTVLAVTLLLVTFLAWTVGVVVPELKITLLLLAIIASLPLVMLLLSRPDDS